MNSYYETIFSSEEDYQSWHSEHFLPKAEEVMKEAADDLINQLSEKFPNHHFGCWHFEYGKMFLKVYREVCRSVGPLDKDVFDEFMNEYLSRDSRVFLREPLKLHKDDKLLGLQKCWIYWNDNQNITVESASMYIARYVRDELISKIVDWNDGHIGLYFTNYSAYGKLVDGPIYALQHFGKLNERDLRFVIERMKCVAARYKTCLDIVHEPEIYSHSDNMNYNYILVKYDPNI